eukprot:CAMPEP_0170575046 /NCGR_PEP_ID=MMETSP0224-20130122/3642_1 /TAXON_ID=285029 /ORGANISM="Togula jolla, Strain CCCM 725" /LENGTH=372 /DNA_ID=CAMNT_0010897779 /DNA_START=100 /DNA_END=1216 /DNA_ORIENTATION=-
MNISQAHLLGRFAELEGRVHAIDRDHSKQQEELKERQEHTESKLADLSVAVHKAAATARGELRRAGIELNDRIAEVEKRLDASENSMLGKLNKEMLAMSWKLEANRTSLGRLIQDLEEKLLGVQKGQAEVESRCNEHMNSSLRDAVRQLEERCSAISSAMSGQAEQASRDLSASEQAAAQHAEAQEERLGCRIDAAIAAAEQQSQRLEERLESVNAHAGHAVAVAGKAVETADRHIQDGILKASQALIAKIKAASGGAVSEPLQAAELESGFCTQVAREALDCELQAVVDRATKRLQVVSDDLAVRTAALHDGFAHAELRMQKLTENTTRQAAALEARVQVALLGRVALRLAFRSSPYDEVPKRHGSGAGQR